MTRKSINHIIRDDKWLISRLDYLWIKYFPDVPQTNKVFIQFGRLAKIRLGSIKYNKKSGDSLITITSMFRQKWVPQDVVDHTIAHELIHYAHGFSSSHPKLHKYPHAGGIVKREMLTRNMKKLFSSYKEWIKTYRKSLSGYG